MLRLSKTLLAAVVAAPLSIAAWSAKAETADLVETAQAAGSFATLIQAVEAAGLADTLKGGGPYTIFAPTDEAFAALPEGKLETLLEPENKDQLVKVLTYHVVPGKVTSGDIAGKMSWLKTLEGSNVKVNSASRATKVDEAAIVMPDVLASNGVIHVIDRVIVPNES